MAVIASLHRSGHGDGIVNAARRIAQEAAERSAELDDDQAFLSEDTAALRQAGLLSAPLPIEYGGLGLGTTPETAILLCSVLRLIGAGSLPLGRLYEGHVNALRLVRAYASDEQMIRIAKDVHDGRFFGVWNTDNPKTGLRLVPTPGPCLRLEGGKTFASGSGFVERPLVTARTSDGKTVMVIPRLDPRERADLFEHGISVSATDSIDLSGLEVDTQDVIGQAGDYERQPLLSGGAWRFAAVQLGGIERLLEELRAHHRRTGRGEDPYQLARLGEAASATETARLWVERGARMAEYAGLESDRVVSYINLTRLSVEKAGLSVLDLVHRSIGLTGFMRSHPIEKLSRDLAVYLRQPASDRSLAVAARFVLDDIRAVHDIWQ